MRGDLIVKADPHTMNHGKIRPESEGGDRNCREVGGERIIESRSTSFPASSWPAAFAGITLTFGAEFQVGSYSGPDSASEPHLPPNIMCTLHR